MLLFGHELVEFRSIPCAAEPIKEFHELPLFLFEPAQGVVAILVESRVAA